MQTHLLIAIGAALCPSRSQNAVRLTVMYLRERSPVGTALVYRTSCRTQTLTPAHRTVARILQSDA